MRVLVVGAGIIGISTSIRLQEAGHEVLIVADRFGKETTSYGAGGQWLPYKAEPRDKVVQWALETYEEYKKQILILPPNLVTLTDGSFVSTAEFNETEHWFKDILPLYKIEETIEGEVRWLAHSNLPIVTTGWYLEHLYEQFQERGGKMIRERVSNLIEAKKKYRADILVNCTGLGSKDLLQDSELYGIQGQVVKLRSTSKSLSRFLDRTESENIVHQGCEIVTYVFPRPDGIIIGGYAVEEGKLSPIPSKEITKLLIERASLLNPELKDLEIIEEWVGVRPCRSNVRLEFEWMDNEAVIHNYGHGGSGWTVCWGCANEVLKQVNNHSIASKL